MIPPHPYRKSRSRSVNSSGHIPQQTSFKSELRPSIAVVTRSIRSQKTQDKYDHQTALLHELGYDAWKLTPPHLKCESCRQNLDLSALDRCTKCHQRYSIIDLIRMRAMATEKAFRTGKKVKVMCPSCSRPVAGDPSKRKKRKPELDCFVVVDGETRRIQACNPKCHAIATRRMERLIRCLEQMAHTERKANREATRQERELSNLRSVMNAMKAGLKQMSPKVSPSRKPASTTRANSPN